MTRPDHCIYCDGTGKAKGGGECGFCDKGVPLDTQEDWDETWGKILDAPGDMDGQGSDW